MHIVIAGGTGFLGRPLSAALHADGHQVTVLARSDRARVPAGVRLVSWDPQRTAAPWSTEIEGAAAVINLAGEPIADRRWTAAQKRRIEDSRVVATRRLATAIGEAANPPAVLVSGSGIGFYGPCGDEIVTEDTGAGHDFLAGVCRRWEAAAVAASSSRTRVVCIRSGLVLGMSGGAFRKMLPPFRFGLGGRFGSGRQFMPWIHLADWVDLARHVLRVPEAVGPVNASAPAPVTNAEFAKELGRVLGRPAVAPVPGFVLKIALGEMAGPLLLSGQRAVPAKATQLGFRFTYPTLAVALDNLLHH
ncbi:MAG TPA: TIGR01777 family oxidoreductase [Vicinamibacterales bacterium]|nr:TIGR01777 family oxidoreductase [Vicinamibacterales bacterium]